MARGGAAAWQRMICIISFGLSLLSGGPALAQEAAPSSPSSLENFRAQVSTSVREAAQAIDNFFVDEEFEAEENDSSLRLRFGGDYDEKDGFSGNFSPSLRLRLPGVQQMLLFEAEGLTDASDDPEDERPAEQFALGDTDEDFEFRLRLLESIGAVRVSPEAGLRFDGVTPQPFGGVRLRRSWDLGEDWTLLATERMRLYSDRGFESLTRLQADRLIFEDTLFRIDMEALWRVDDEVVSYGPGVRLFHVLGDDSAISLGARLVFNSGTAGQLDQISSALRYRRRFLTDWTTIELAPRVVADEEDDFSLSYGGAVRFEVEF